MRRFLGLVLIILLPAAADGGDWPQLLGPTRDGVLPESPAGAPLDPAVLWDRELGTGFSGPVVVAGRVYIAHRLDDDLVLDAVDAGSGVRLWRFARPTDYNDSFGFDDGPRGVPTVAGERIFVHGADGVLDAVDLATGESLWKVDTVADYASPQGYFGRACSPLVIDDRVILTPGGQRDGKAAGVIALNAASGALMWQSVADEAGYASPLIAGAGRLLCWMRNELWLLAAETGEVVARRPLRARMDASVNAAQPQLLSDGRVLVSAGYGVGLNVLQLPELTPDWNQEGLMDSHYSTPVLLGGLLFGFDGRQEMGQTLRCIDLTTRQKRWQSDTVPGGTLIRVGKFLLAVTEQGELWVVEAVDSGFNLLQRAQILRSGHRAQLAYADGVLFARDNERLVAVRVFE